MNRVRLALLLAVVLVLAGAGDAVGASCGTVGTPTACTLTVSSNTTFTFTNFTLVTASGSGGGNTYQGDDISIDLATGGGTTALLTFSKNAAGPTPGIVFLANAGQTAAFTLSYDVAVTPEAPGAVKFVSPVVSSMIESHLNNGLATFQTIMPSAPVCLTFSGSTTANCALAPGFAGSALFVGNIISLTGNTGNASIGSFQSLFQAEFSEAVPAIGGVGAALSLVLLVVIGAVQLLRRAST
jgi:hypothetical protein